MSRIRLLLLILLYLSLSLAIYVIVGIDSYTSWTIQQLVVTRETSYQAYPVQSLILVVSMIVAVILTTWIQGHRFGIRSKKGGIYQVVAVSLTFLVAMFGLLVIGLYALPLAALLLILNLPMGGAVP